MRFFYLLTYATAALLPLCASARSFENGSLTFNVLSSTEKTVEVKATATTISGDVTIPTTVTDSDTTYNVTRIARYGFRNCKSLTSVVIPEGIQEIGLSAFSGCSALTGTLKLPASVSNIGNQAFERCALTQLDLPETMKTWGRSCFQNNTKLTWVKIPDAMQILPFGSFNGCSATDSVVWGSGLKGMEQAGFNGCAFTKVVIPEGIQYIGMSVFYRNAKLEEIDIPSTVDSIGQSAFYSCKVIKKVTCRAEVPPVMGTSKSHMVIDATAFTQGVLYVPQGSIEAYTNAEDWKNFTTILPIKEGVSTIDIEDNGVKEYYDLQGRRVNEQYLTPGIYIVREGNKATKQVVR